LERYNKRRGRLKVKTIVIDDRKKFQEKKRKQYGNPVLWLTAQGHPAKQRERGDKEPFICLPSTKNKMGDGIK
jgi:hypothetical protein